MAVEEVLTLAEVAAHLKLPVKTTRKFVVAGTIRGFKVGRQWRVRESDLQAYIDHQRYVEQQQRGERHPPSAAIRELDGWDTFR
jgi:excisionase family DNA binding protein